MTTTFLSHSRAFVASVLSLGRGAEDVSAYPSPLSVSIVAPRIMFSGITLRESRYLEGFFVRKKVV